MACCVGGRFGSVAGAGFLEDCSDVVGGGVLADDEPFADLTVDAITKRASSIDEYVDASVAVAKVTHRYTVDDVLGPLLLAAMGTNTSGPSERLSRSQARFLRSLVANPAIWSPSDGSAAHWFQKVGIPHDRDACERLSRRTFRR